jgi:hypothetical protein
VKRNESVISPNIQKKSKSANKILLHTIQGRVFFFKAPAHNVMIPDQDWPEKK